MEAVVYWTPGYFEKEYAKYNVTEAVDMTMEDLLDVTDQMMAYLRGKRADLHVDTTMGGVSREFFNEREIAHMEDVRGLFLDALALSLIHIWPALCTSSTAPRNLQAGIPPRRTAFLSSYHW